MRCVLTNHNFQGLCSACCTTHTVFVLSIRAYSSFPISMDRGEPSELHPVSVSTQSALFWCSWIYFGKKLILTHKIMQHFSPGPGSSVLNTLQFGALERCYLSKGKYTSSDIFETMGWEGLYIAPNGGSAHHSLPDSGLHLAPDYMSYILSPYQMERNSQ